MKLELAFILTAFFISSLAFSDQVKSDNVRKEGEELSVSIKAVIQKGGNYYPYVLKGWSVSLDASSDGKMVSYCYCKNVVFFFRPDYQYALAGVYFLA